MTNFLDPFLEARLGIVLYRFRFISLYIIFGFLSLIIEFLIRTYVIKLGISDSFSTIFAVIWGNVFAFWTNVRFNFKIPRVRRNRALIYFIIISSFSGLMQWSLKTLSPYEFLSYEWGRLVTSGSVFIIAYMFHRKYSFRNFKKVGVAIYANGIEDLENIYSRIGHYPDFIHVDIIDKSMSKNAEDVKTYRLETMKAYWPNTQVQTHIMSTKPSKWLDEVLPHSDVVYIHAESEENIDELLDKIRIKNKMAGLALTMSTNPYKVSDLLIKADYVLLLTIPNPGSSGQKFDSDGLERIKQINNLSFRSQFVLCIDGGINENIVNVLEAENIVSGSSVLKNDDPKKQIMRLQTVGRYEA